MNEQLKPQLVPRSHREALKREIWEKTLVVIPTTLGRLLYVGSFYGETIGIYRDADLPAPTTEFEPDTVLRELHEEIFATWMSFSLQDQHEELLRYLKSLTTQPSHELKGWLKTDAYLKLIPESAEPAERELYRSDIELLLEMLKNDLS